MSKKLEDLLLVDEIGERISESIIEFFNNSENQLLIKRLKELGIQLEIKESNLPLNEILLGKSFVISGVFENHSRDELKKIIELNSGKVSSSISKKTNYLLGGNNIGPSKLVKVEKLEIPIISENDLIEILNSKP
jgi:DNA ligase (NAD+)